MLKILKKIIKFLWKFFLNLVLLITGMDCYINFSKILPKIEIDHIKIKKKHSKKFNFKEKSEKKIFFTRRKRDSRVKNHKPVYY